MLSQLPFGEFRMRSLILAAALLLSLSANAALVDNGSFTTDTASGLDWLDLSATKNLTISEALSSNSGWRLATNSEIEDLFQQIFPHFVASHSSGFAQQNSYEYFEGQWAGADLFKSLFGPVQLAGGSYPYDYTYGLYYDEGDILRMMGTGGYNVYGTEFDYTIPDYVVQDGSAIYGTFLVSTTAVPVPAAAWLFGSALAGLSFIRRRIVSP